jgi:hypothetical protein
MLELGDTFFQVIHFLFIVHFDLEPPFHTDEASVKANRRCLGRYKAAVLKMLMNGDNQIS